MMSSRQRKDGEGELKSALTGQRKKINKGDQDDNHCDDKS